MPWVADAFVQHLTGILAEIKRERMMWKKWAMAAWAVVAVSAGMARADLTVSAAISLKGALEKAQPELEKAAGEKITFNFGASGTLAGQIQQGAPVDLFISADRATVQKLLTAKKVDAGSDLAIAGNDLVLIYTKLATAAQQKPADFSDLMKVKKLAIGDPKVVPAGTYAKETLTYLKIYDSLDKAGKMVTAENVAQVVTFVQRGDADAGIVYATDAKTAGMDVVATADPASHSAIEYVSAVVTGSSHHDAAVKTQHALTQENVQGVLKGFGFTAPPAAATASKPAAEK